MWSKYFLNTSFLLYVNNQVNCEKDSDKKQPDYQGFILLFC